MYASQTRTNTKYTEFLRNYYPPDKNNVTDNRNNNSTCENFGKNLPLPADRLISENIHDASEQITLDLNGDGRDYGKSTKFSHLFSKEQSHALQLKLLQHEAAENGLTKVFSDTDLVLLHNKVKDSFNSLQPRYNSAGSNRSVRSHIDGDTKFSKAHNKGHVKDSKPPAEESGVRISEPKSHIGETRAIVDAAKSLADQTGPYSFAQKEARRLEDERAPTEISDLEQNLHKLNEETLRVLSRARSHSVGNLEDVTGGPDLLTNVSYQEILRAEHIALRRELLNNLREISRATFYEEMYSGKGPGRGDGPGHQTAPNPGESPAFDLNLQGTADPAQRVTDWIRDSREHLNLSAKELEVENENENEKPLHASLFHDSIWHENEEEVDAGANVLVIENNAREIRKNLKKPSQSLENPVIQNNIVIQNYHKNHLPFSFPAPPPPDQLHAEELAHAQSDPDSPATVMFENPIHEHAKPESTDTLEIVQENLAKNVGENLSKSAQENLPENLGANFPENLAAKNNENLARLMARNLNETESAAENWSENVPRHLARNLHETEGVLENFIENVPRHVARNLNENLAKDFAANTLEGFPPKQPFSKNGAQTEMTDGKRNIARKMQPAHAESLDSSLNAAQMTDANASSKAFEPQTDRGGKNYPNAKIDLDSKSEPGITEEDDSHVIFSFRKFVPHSDTDIDDESLCSDEAEDEPEIHKRFKKLLRRSSKLSGTDLLPPGTIVPQPTSEKFPELIYHPRIRYNKPRGKRNGGSVNSDNSSGRVKPAESFDQKYLSKSEKGFPISRKPSYPKPKNVATRSLHNFPTSRKKLRAPILGKILPGQNSRRSPPNFSVSETNLTDAPKGVEIPAPEENLPPKYFGTTKHNFPAPSKRFSKSHSSIIAAPEHENLAKSTSVKELKLKPASIRITKSLIADFASSFEKSDVESSQKSSKFSKANDPPKPQAEVQTTGYLKNPKMAGNKVPGFHRRHNMDEWVAKKVWFYINGDEHFPKFEYRFRPKRDVKDLDALCDILSNRLKLPRGVRHIFTIDGQRVERLEELRHEHHYVASSTKKFKAINYGRGASNFQIEDEGGESRSRSRDSNRRPPSAPTRKPPTIRIRRESSLNGLAWGSPQQLTSDSANTTVEAPPRRSRKRQNSKAGKNLEVSEPVVIAKNHVDSGNHLKVSQENIPYRSPSRESSKGNGSVEGRENYSPEAERFVRAAIDRSRPVERQVIRIINGNEPTIQSQVLLNTKTSQPWDDLVVDLGQAVKLRRRGPCYMETISGRRIQSYSQLRSELLAGNHAFYVYTVREEFPELGVATGPSRSPRVRKVSRPASPPAQNGLSLPNINVQRELGKPSATLSQRSNGHLGNLNDSTRKAPTKPAARKISTISNPGRANNNSLLAADPIERNGLMASKSNPNLSTFRNSPSGVSVERSSQTLNPPTNANSRKRSTRRRRSQNSVYLASADRSRSVSP